MSDENIILRRGALKARESKGPGLAATTRHGQSQDAILPALRKMFYMSLSTTGFLRLNLTLLLLALGPLPVCCSSLQ